MDNSNFVNAKRTWIYDRVPNELLAHTMASRIDSMRDYAYNHVMNVVGESCDCSSGRDIYHHGIRQVCEAVEWNEVDYVIVIEKHVLLNDDKLLEILMKTFEASNVELIELENA